MLEDAALRNLSIKSLGPAKITTVLRITEQTQVVHMENAQLLTLPREFERRWH